MLKMSILLFESFVNWHIWLVWLHYSLVQIYYGSLCWIVASMIFHSRMMYVANGTGRMSLYFTVTFGTETLPLCLSWFVLQFDYTIVCWSFFNVKFFFLYLFLICVFVLVSTGILSRDTHPFLLVLYCMYSSFLVVIVFTVGTCVTCISFVFTFPLLRYPSLCVGHVVTLPLQRCLHPFATFSDIATYSSCSSLYRFINE